MADLDGSVGLDVTDALSGIDRIDDALGSAVTSFKVALAEALDLLSSVSVGETDASSVTTAIDEAVQAADLAPVVEADASGVTEEIDAAVAGADATVEPDVAADGITQEIDAAIDSADSTVTVDADTSAVSTDIEQAVDGADATVTVEADTTAAQASISDLGETAQQASGGLDSLGGGGDKASAALEAVGPAAGFAAGNLDDLGGAASGLVPEMAGVVAGAGGVVAAGAALFQSALDQQTALERLNRTFGETAADVQQIDVGGLNEDISSLALRTGSADEGLQNFAASFGLLGQQAGRSNPEIAGTVDQMIALATRASVLNPELGGAEEIIGRMSTALARGGRFAAQFGLDLNAAEINARALADTGKTSADQLTLYDKAAAGAALSTEKLGSQLGKDINDGANSDAIKLRSLKTALDETAEAAGQNLVGPVVEDLQRLEPALEQITTLFGQGLTAALNSVTPIFVAFGDAAEKVNGVLGDGTIVDLLTTGLGAATGTGILGELNDLFGLGDSGSKAMDDLRKSLDGAGAGFEHLDAPLDKTIDSMTQAVVQSSGVATAMDHIGVTTGDLAAAAEQGKAGVDGLRDRLEAAGKTSGEFADDSDHVLDATTQLANAFQRNARAALEHMVATGQLNGEQVHSLETTTKLASGNTNYLGVLRNLAPAAAAQAEAQAQANAAGEAGVGPAKALADAAQRGADAQGKLSAQTSIVASTMLDSLVAHGSLTAAQRDMAIAVNTSKDGSVDYLGALKEIDPKLAEQADAQGKVNSGLGDTRTAFEVAADAADRYKTALDEALGILVSADQANIRLHDTVDKVTKSLQDSAGSIDINTEKGRAARGAVDDLATQTGSYIETLIREGASQDQVTAARDEGIKRLQQLEQQYPQLKPLIDPYIATLQAIPADKGTQVHADGTAQATSNVQDVQRAVEALHSQGIVVTAETIQAQIAIQKVIDKLNALPGGALVGVQANTTKLLQAGGPFAAGEVITVGERGPETMVLGSSGFVLNHSDAMRAASSGGMSDAQFRELLDVLRGARPITINQVAEDPDATAFAVGARLGQQATR